MHCKIFMWSEDSATDFALQVLLEVFLLMMSEVTGEQEAGPTYLASTFFVMT